MPDCGCNASSDSCYPNSNVVAQAVVPITYNDCSGNSGDASNCPVYFQPSTPTTGACVTIPAVGATFSLPLLCNASKFTIGQWIQFATFGRYPIVGINSSTNLLTLRNSCSDGTTAIPGNPDPGTQVCGPNNIWVTGSDPCLDAEAQCDAFQECLQAISDDNPLCTPDFPVTTDAECVFIMGLTASCDAGDCPQPDDPNCWKKLQGPRFCKDTICWADGLIIETPEEVTSLVSITEDGCLRESLASGFVSLRIVMDDRTGSGNAASLNTDLNYLIDTADYGVPDKAKSVSIRGFYYFDLDAGGGTYDANTYLRGPAEAVNSANTRLTYGEINGGAGQEWISPFNAVVPVTPTDKRIHHEWQNVATAGSHPQIRVYIALDGYFQ